MVAAKLRSAFGADQVRHAPASDPAWRRFLANTKTTLFQSDAWANFIGDYYGWEPYVAIALQNDAVIGGTPYMLIDDFRGLRRITYPFSDACDSIGADGLGLAALDGIPWQLRTRRLPEVAPDTSASLSGVYQSVALPDDPGDVAALWHRPQVQNAKRMQRAGGRMRCDASSGAIEKFYELSTRVRKEKFGLLPQPKSFFDQLAERFFPKSGFVAFAEVGDLLVSAAVCLWHGDRLYVKYSASNQDALGLRPNNYLFGELMHLAVKEKRRYLDLGISGQAGLARFKQHLGAQSEPYYTIQLNKETPSQSVARLEETLRDLTTLLTQTDIPTSTAQRAGDILYRYFV